MISNGFPRKPVARAALALASTNITTAAWVQLIAATDVSAGGLEVHNPSTQVLELAIGGVGSEAALPVYIYPSTTPQWIPLDGLIPKGSRVSAKAVSNTANSGYLLLNLFD